MLHVYVCACVRTLHAMSVYSYRSVLFGFVIADCTVIQSMPAFPFFTPGELAFRLAVLCRKVEVCRIWNEGASQVARGSSE